jgi:acetyl/propionyl-CoA carboxylase alpha subunit
MSYSLSVHGRPVALQIRSRRPELRILIDGSVHQVAEAPCPPGEFSIVVDGVAYRGWRCVVGDQVHVRLGAHCHVIGLPQTLWETGELGLLEHEIRADMPGVVVAVHCAAGQNVDIGDKLLTIESMKLQMSLTASHRGLIEAVHVAAESVFERGAPLISFARQAEGIGADGQESRP